MLPTILLVDDEDAIVELVDVYLRNEGYRILKANNGNDALEIVRAEDVDLVVLDVMMPGLDGLKTCIKIRETRQMPIIMLSAKGQDLDKITGLSIGADDYVTKPFSPLELLARVKSQLRRYKQTSSQRKKEESVLEIDDLAIDTASREVRVGGDLVKLTPREFSILTLLAENRGIVYSIEHLYEQVWNEPFIEAGNTVMVHIRKIREKLERNPRDPKYIKTVWGVGYKIDK